MLPHRKLGPLTPAQRDTPTGRENVHLRANPLQSASGAIVTTLSHDEASAARIARIPSASTPSSLVNRTRTALSSQEALWRWMLDDSGLRVQASLRLSLRYERPPCRGRFRDTGSWPGDQGGWFRNQDREFQEHPRRGGAADPGADLRRPPRCRRTAAHRTRVRRAAGGEPDDRAAGSRPA